MFEPSTGCVAEHADLEARLADPAVHADQAAPAGSAGATPSSPRSSTPTGQWRAGRRRPRGRRASWPPRTRRSRAEAASARRAAQAELADRLRRLLVPRDPDDDRDVILEVKAGEGGEESALFAGDLLRMYLRYAERRGWKTEVLEATRVRPRRLQGRDRRGQGARARPSPARRRGPG